MSKRAEKFACKYAGFDAPPTRRDELENREKCDIFGACLDAYEQAEKDTIERAIQWLITHVDDYIVDMEVSRYKPSDLHVGGMCWEHLKQAMKEENG